MFNQPSVTCEAALLGALRNRRLVGSLLPQKNSKVVVSKQYNFPALPYPIGQSLLYPLVLTVAQVNSYFAQIRAELFAFLRLWHSAIKRSHVQILDLATQL